MVETFDTQKVVAQDTWMTTVAGKILRPGEQKGELARSAFGMWSERTDLDYGKKKNAGDGNSDSTAETQYDM